MLKLFKIICTVSNCFMPLKCLKVKYCIYRSKSEGVNCKDDVSRNKLRQDVSCVKPEHVCINRISTDNMNDGHLLQDEDGTGVGAEVAKREDGEVEVRVFVTWKCDDYEPL